MTATPSVESQRTWNAIDREKGRDRLIRRICITSWSVTFALLLLLGIFVGVSTAPLVKWARIGEVAWMDVFRALTPSLIVLGIVALLIAALSTVGIFLRMRTTTLLEVQARLAALEEMLATRPEPR